MEVVGEGAFWKCAGLEEALLGTRVKTIEKDAFRGCRLLKSVVVPNSVEAIGEDAFMNCKGLKELRLTERSKTIE